MVQIVLIGEALVELTQSDVEPDSFRKGLGGDTFNTAIYLARLLGKNAVRYVTRLGTDTLSDWIFSEITREGINAECIARIPDKSPGLSLIECSPDGERAFTYWRTQSSARDLLQDNEDEMRAIADAPALYVSAVSLAILSPGARAQLIDHMMTHKRQGREVYFDLNYRPALWENTELARTCITLALLASTLALPSFDDVSDLWGAEDANSALETLQGLGATSVLLKTGGGACVLFGQRRRQALSAHAHQ